MAVSNFLKMHRLLFSSGNVRERQDHIQKNLSTQKQELDVFKKVLVNNVIKTHELERKIVKPTAEEINLQLKRLREAKDRFVSVKIRIKDLNPHFEKIAEKWKKVYEYKKQTLNSSRVFLLNNHTKEKIIE